MDLRALRKRAGLRILDVTIVLDGAQSSMCNCEKVRTISMLEILQVFRL